MRRAALTFALVACGALIGLPAPRLAPAVVGQAASARGGRDDVPAPTAKRREGAAIVRAVGRHGDGRLTWPAPLWLLGDPAPRAPLGAVVDVVWAGCSARTGLGAAVPGRARAPPPLR